jgi:hypothetical protein
VIRFSPCTLPYDQNEALVPVNRTNPAIVRRQTLTSTKPLLKRGSQHACPFFVRGIARKKSPPDQKQVISVIFDKDPYSMVTIIRKGADKEEIERALSTINTP